MIKVTATGTQEFEMINAKLDKLPFLIREQIESAEKAPTHDGIICKLKSSKINDQNICLPKSGVQQILESDRIITIIIDNYAFIFKIQRFEQNISFMFNQ